MLSNFQELWWETISGPLRLVEQTVAHLDVGKSVILQGAEFLPWTQYFQDCVSQRVGTAQLQFVKWEEDSGTVVPQLLSNISPHYANLCPSDEKRQLEYLKREQILSDTLIWIDSTECENLEKLIRFISSYRSKSLREEGGFVVGVSNHIALPALSSRVEVLQCSEYISNGDMHLFASIMAKDIDSLPVELNDYAAYLSAELAGKQAEQIQPLLYNIDFVQDDPHQIAAYIKTTDLVSDDSETDILAYVSHFQWEAQLQAAFPGVEIQRRKLIEQRYDTLEKALKAEYWSPAKEQSGFVCQYEDELEDPYDLELGTIVYMLYLRQNEDRTSPLLCIDDSEWRQRILFLHKCRNKMAHHTVVDPNTFYQLMQIIRT